MLMQINDSSITCYHQFEFNNFFQKMVMASYHLIIFEKCMYMQPIYSRVQYVAAKWYVKVHRREKKYTHCSFSYCLKTLYVD